ncbi:MAG: hypothetical protein IBJ10_02210 [Phycisphaerales bacterium]|nr:hypothetical protein [Phycisphaerales bacterium]
MSREVVYVRGEASIPVFATVGRTRFEQADEYGVIRRSEARDFLIRAADLVVSGDVGGPEPVEDVSITPAAGDRIRERFGDVWHIYEVGPIPGEPAFRFSDPGRITLRIHTFHVGEEAAA